MEKVVVLRDMEHRLAVLELMAGQPGSAVYVREERPEQPVNFGFLRHARHDRTHPSSARELRRAEKRRRGRR